MRKRIVVLSLLAIFGAGICRWLWASWGSSAPDPPSAFFTGSEPGPSSRTAGFYVTNNSHQAILLLHTQVQKAVDSGWKTLTESEIEVSHELEAGASGVNFSQLLEAGEHRKILVEWPYGRPWRVCITYVRELRGLNAVILKGRTAWRTRSTSPLRQGRVFGSEQVITKEVAK
jgi:hypothetical protein